MVELLARADVDETAAVLARAFRDNPGIVAILKDDPPEERLRHVERGMRGIAEAVRRYGRAEVVKEGGRVVAAALSFPPGGYPPPIAAQLLVAWGPLLAGPARALRFGRADAWMRRRHPRYPHWYLWVLGVEPERQGQGLGSRLLKSLRAKAETDGVPCYLETDKPSSVRIYEKHGYQVQLEETHAGLDLKLWFMRRDLPAT